MTEWSTRVNLNSLLKQLVEKTVEEGKNVNGENYRSGLEIANETEDLQSIIEKVKNIVKNDYHSGHFRRRDKATAEFKNERTFYQLVDKISEVTQAKYILTNCQENCELKHNAGLFLNTEKPIKVFASLNAEGKICADQIVANEDYYTWFHQLEVHVPYDVEKEKNTGESFLETIYSDISSADETANVIDPSQSTNNQSEGDKTRSGEGGTGKSPTSKAAAAAPPAATSTVVTSEKDEVKKRRKHKRKRSSCEKDDNSQEANLKKVKYDDDSRQYLNLKCEGTTWDSFLKHVNKYTENETKRATDFQTHLQKLREALNTSNQFFTYLDRFLTKLPFVIDPVSKKIHSVCSGCPIHCLTTWNLKAQQGRPPKNLTETDK